MASLIHNYANWFKNKKTPVKRWYSDGVGKFAFRVEVDGQPFIACARSASPTDGETSVMRRVCGKAQTTGAYVVVRTPAGDYVFDPVTILATGRVEDPHDEDRAKRGEQWVYVDVEHACRFELWVDGYGQPDSLADTGRV